MNYTLRLDTDLVAFYSVYEDVRAALAAFVTDAGDVAVTFYDLRTGSVIVSGSNQITSGDTTAAHSSMATSLTNGGSIAGFSIL